MTEISITSHILVHTTVLFYTHFFLFFYLLYYLSFSGYYSTATFTFTANSHFPVCHLHMTSAQSGRWSHCVALLRHDTLFVRSSDQLACTRSNAAVAEALRGRGLEGQSTGPLQLVQRGGESAQGLVGGTMRQGDGGGGRGERKQVCAFAAEGGCGRAADHLVGLKHCSGCQHGLKGVRIHDVGERISLALTTDIAASLVAGVTGVTQIPGTSTVVAIVVHAGAEAAEGIQRQLSIAVRSYFSGSSGETASISRGRGGHGGVQGR
mmetsp:Transcript_57624/g.101253  ORF Transcript_57624/g.101253 Transcript_57624/m.101253 type:complete len:265 (+) Transcript_57624:146-940(+)